MNISFCYNRIKKTVLTIVMVMLVSAQTIVYLPMPIAHATTGTNHQINFQGKLVNTDGTNVTNGNYSISFKIYTVSTGGSAVWTETWDGTGGTSQVAVSSGIFRVALGTYTTLPGSIDFNTDNIYLGVKVGADSEMTPRVRFTSVPQAFNAEKVAGLSVTNTTGTLTIPNSKTIQFADAFTTTGAYALTLTTTGATTATLPSGTITLADLSTSQSMDLKTLTNAGNITQTGAATITSGTGAVGLNGLTTITNTTSPQLSVRYDTTNKVTVGVSSSGTTTFTAAGTTPYFNFAGANVGVGTTTPGYALQVGTTFAAYSGGMLGVGYMQLKASSLAGTNIVSLNAGGDSFINGGNLGVGTTSPQNKLDIESTQTTGSIIGYNAPSAVTLTGALTGITADLSTNYTATGYGVTGESITLPAVTNTGAGTYAYNGLTLTSGALIQNTGAGTDTWNGLNITMPNTTATTGTVTSTGIKITGGTVTSGTAYALTTTASAGNVGIQTITPTTMLQVGNPTTVGGNIGIAGVTSGLITINTASAAGTWTMTLPTTGGTNNYVMTTNGSGVTSWTDPGSVGTRWNAITAPNGNQTLAMAAYTTAFNWDSLTTGTGMTMASSSISSGNLVALNTTGTAGLTNQTVLNISSSGANGTGAQTTYGLQVANTKTGTSVNVGAYLTASGGSSNYGLIVNAGNVGIGLTNPGTTLDVTGTTRSSSTITASNGLTMTTGTLSLTGNAAATVNTGANDITFTSGHFNTTATGINGTAIGATTASTGAFTTLSATTSYTQTAGTFSLTSANTTQTTTSSAMAVNVNSLTSGTGIYAASSTLQNGKLVDLQVSGTAATANQTALNILTTGANANAGVTTYGGYISNTHSTNTSTNVGLYLNASGGATANYGLVVAAGNVGIGNVAPTAALDVTGTAHVSGAVTLDSTLSVGTIITASGALNLQAANGTVAFNKSGVQNKADVYASDGTSYTELTHNGTNGQLSASAGEMQISGAGATNQFILGDASAVDLLFAQSSTIGGTDAGGKTLTFGVGADVLNFTTAATTYNIGTLTAATGAIINNTGTTSTGLLVSNATGQSANLLDLQVNSVSKYSVDASGNSTQAGNAAINGGGITSSTALTVTPNAGSNLNIALSTTGDLAVNTNQLYVDTSAGYVGIGATNPTRGRLEVTQSSDTVSGGIAIVNSGVTGSTRLWVDANNISRFDSGGSTTIAFNGTTAGNVGIQTTNPQAMLQVGNPTTVGGNIGIAGVTSGLVTINTASAAGTWTMTLPTTGGTNNYVLTTNGSGVTSWTAPGSIAASWSSLTAPSANLTLAMAAYTTTFNWDSLTTGTGMTMASSSISSGNLVALNTTGTAGLTNQTVLNISSSGANGTGAQTTYGLQVANTKTGTSNNVAGYFTASGGSNNYGLIVNAGNVGIGTTTPTAAGLQNATAGAASVSGELLTGAWYTGGSATTTKPQLLIEPTGTTSTNWSTSGTGLGVNATSGFTGNLFNFQINGTIIAKLLSSGELDLVNGGGFNPSGANGWLTSSGLGNQSANANALFAATANGATITRNVADANPALIVQQVSASSTGDILQIKNNASTVLTVQQGGNVGIGTTTPGSVFDIKTTQTTGTLASIAAPSAVTLTGALTGQAINLSTNYTATGYGVTGQSITLPAVTNTGAGSYAYNGITLTSGALIQNTGAGTNTWNGLNITMPNTTATTGTVTATGIAITGGTVTSGTAYALTTTTSAGNVGIGTASPGRTLDVNGYIRTNTGMIWGADTTRLREISTGILALDQYSGTNTASLRTEYSTTVYGAFGPVNSVGNLTISTTGGSSGHILLSPVGNVGIQTTNPTAMLQVGNPTTVGGNIGIAGVTSGLVTINTASAAGTWTMTLPTTGGTNGYVMTTNGSGTTTWTAPGSIGVKWNNLLGPDGNLTLAMAAYTTTLNWDSLTTGNGFSIGSTSLSSGNLVNLATTSTAAASNTQTILNVAASGTNSTSGQTTYGAQISNIHGGGTSTNVALYLSASGGTSVNYGLIVANGIVAIGNTSTESGVRLNVTGTTPNFATSSGQAAVLSSDSAAINKGGVLSLGGNIIGSGSPITFANIVGAKENSTSGQPAGYLGVYTSSSTSNVLNEWMRITSVGNVGISTTAPLDTLQLAAANTTVGSGEFQGANLVYNGGAEDGANGWTSRDFGIDGSAGSGSVESNSPLSGAYNFHSNNDGGMNQAVQLSPGSAYTLSARVRVDHMNSGGDASQGYLVVGTTATGREISDVACNPNTYDVSPTLYKWVLCSTTFTASAPADVATVTTYVGFRAAGSTHTTDFDNISLVHGGMVGGYNPIATYTGSNGSVGISGNVGIGAVSPTAMLQLGTAGTSSGNIGITGVTSGMVTINTASAAGTWTLTLPTTGGTNNYVMTTNGSGVTSWTAPSTIATSWSSLTAPSANLTLAMAAYTTTFNWDSLTTGTGMTMASSSISSGNLVALNTTGTAGLTNQTVLNISSSGANSNGAQTTYGLQVANTKTGTSVNVGGYFTASGGSTNYGLLVAAGNVGIGNTAPGTALDVTGATRSSSTITASNGLTLTTGPMALTASSGSAALTLTSATNAFNIIGASSGSVLDADTTNNRVGVGTTSPSVNLQVGAVSVDTNLKVVNQAYANGYSTTTQMQYDMIGYYGTTAGSTTDIFSNNGSETGKNVYAGLITNAAYYNSARYSIISNGNELFTIKTGAGGGNVGVGTTAPANKLDIESTQTTGSIVGYNAPSAVTLTGALTGITADLSTNYTATGYGVTGESITLPAVTNTGAGTYAYNGLTITPGAIIQNTGAGTDTWNGLNITMPNTTATTGTVTSTGVKITGGTVTSGTAYALTTTASAGNVGIQTITPTAMLQVGNPTTVGGNIGIAGVTSGLVTINTASAAGTWTLTLPTTGGTNNYVMTTNGSGVTSWTDPGSVGTRWNAITAPNGNQTLAMAAYTTAFNWDSLTTGNAFTIGSTSISSGNLVSMNTSGIAGLTNQTVLNISSSGANGTGAQTTYGLQVANTKTGTSVNVGAYLTASGGSSNYGLIVNAGNVGIGLTNPGTTLDVTGTGRFSSTLTATSGFTMTNGALSMTASSGSAALTLTSATNAFNIIGASSASVLDVDTTNNRVGIGTTTPSQPLEVVTTTAGSASSNYIRLTAKQNAAYAGSFSRIEGYYNDTGNSETAKIAWISLDTNRDGVNDVSGDIKLYTKVAGGALGDSPTVKLTVKNSGNVGIGTTAPANKLDIESTQTTGTLVGMNAPSAVTLTGALTGQTNDLSTNYTATGYGVTGHSILLPAVTNTGAGTYAYNGITLTSGALIQNTGAGTNTWNGLNITMPNTTATTGTVTSTGIKITGGTVTSGTAYAITTTTSAGNVGISTTTPTTFNLEVAGSIGPEADNTRNLGSSGRRFANLYATNLYGAITPTGFTQGSVIFAGASGILSQNNANFFWDNSNARLGIGNTAPGVTLDVTGNGRFFSTLTASNGLVQTTGTLSLTASSGSAALTLSSATNAFNIIGASSATAFNVDTTNNRVGIGTTAPANKLDIESTQTTGTLVGMNAPSAVTLTGALTGQTNDLSTNYTATGYGVTGHSILLPAVTNTGAGTYAYNGITLTSGALIQNTGAGTNTWNGLNITMPNTTATTGTVTSTGIKITGGTVTSGTAYALITDANAGNVGIATATPGYSLQVGTTFAAYGSGILGVGALSLKTAALSGANVVRLDTGGSSFFNGGNLGIGTTTPSTEKLVVAGGGLDLQGAANSVSSDSGLGLSYESYGGRIQSFGSKPLAINPVGNNVGIANTNPLAMLQLGNNGGTAGNLGIAGNTSGMVTINTAAAAGTWTLTLPTSGGTNNYVMTTNGSGVTSWTDPGSVGTRWNAITAPNGNQTLAMAAYTTAFNWDSLTTGNAFTIGSTSISSGNLVSMNTSGTAGLTNQTVLNISSSGANGTGAQTTYGLQVANTKTGTSVNVGGYFTASGGSSNYGLIVAAGNVGIGATNPLSLLDASKAASDTISMANAALAVGDFHALDVGLIGQQTAASPYGFALQVQNKENSSFYPMLLNPLGGNVGIATTNPLAKLSVVGSTTSTAFFTNTAASSSSQGAGIVTYSDDGAALASGDRLGFMVFGGAKDASHTLVNAAGITSYASEAWGAAAAGAYLAFETDTAGTTTRTEKMRLTDSGNVGIGTTTTAAKLDVESTQTTGTVSLVGAPSAVTLTGALIGRSTDLSTNYTATGFGVTGESITLPAVTNTGAGTYAYNGITLTTGALIQNTGAGTDTWNGLNITMPNTTATTGTVTSTGIKITGGTVTSGTAYALTTTASAGNVGIETTAPTTMLQVGNPTTVGGNIGIAGVTSGLVTINTASAAGTWTLTLPTTGGTNNYVMTTNGSGVTSWTDPGSVGTRWNAITAPNGNQTLAMAAYTTTFNWDSLTTGNGYTIASNSLTSGNLVNLVTTSTAAASNTQTILYISASGVNGTASQTTYGTYVSNAHGGSGTNVAGYFSATGGSNNYGLLVFNGNVGVGTLSPNAKIDSLGSTEQLRLSYDSSHYASFTANSSGNLTIAPNGGASNITGTLGVSSTLTASNGLTLTTGAWNITASSGAEALTLTSATNAFNIIGASSSSVLDVDTTNNRVGIGMTNPSYKLDIAGGIARENTYNLADAATNNLLVNGDFEMNAYYGWSSGGSPTVVTGGYSGNYALQITGPGGNTLSDDYIPVNPVTDVFELEAWVKKTVAGGTPGVLYFGYIAYDVNKSAIGTAPCGSYCYFAASGYTVPADSAWHKLTATTTGEGTSYPDFPVGTRYVRVLGLVNYSASGDAVTLLDHITLRRINNGPLFVGNNFASSNMTDQSQATKLYTTSGNNFVITPPSTGNVGIGTTAPGYTLNVVNSSDGAETIPIQIENNHSTAGSASAIGFSVADTVGATTAKISNYYSGGGSDRGLAFSTYGASLTEKMRLTGGGNLGIGTTGPANKLDIESTQTTGSIIGYNAPSAVTLTGALTGITADLSTNYTATGYGVTGESITLPAVTNTGAGTYAYNGLTITPGAIIQNTGAGTDTWNGLNITMPNTTATTGTVTSTGIKITGGTVTSGTAYALTTTTSAGNVGIGLTNPGTTLDVTGTGRFSSTLTASSGLTMTTGALNLTASSGSAALTLTSATNAFVIDTNTLDVDTTNHRVGIGTTTPGAGLDVEANAGSIKIGSTGDAAYYTTLNTYFSTDTFNLQVGGNKVIETGGYYTPEILKFFTYDASSSTEKMRISGANVGINTTNPQAMLQVGNPTTVGGNIGIAGVTSGLVTINTASAAGTWTMTLPTSGGTNNYVMTTNGSGVTSWTDPGSVGTRWNAITAPNGNLTLAMAAYTTAFNWDSLTTGTGMTMASSSISSGNLVALNTTGTAGLTNQTVLNISSSGANGTGAQTTYGLQVANTKTGTSVNVGAYLTASGGSSNYGLLVAAGNVGIGTATPGNTLEINGTNINARQTSSIATINSNFGAVNGSGGYDSLVLSNGGTDPSTGIRGSALSFKAATYGTASSYSTGRILSYFDTSGGSSPGYAGGILALQYPTADNTFTSGLLLRNGNVGISTTAPANKLDIESTQTTGTLVGMNAPSAVTLTGALIGQAINVSTNYTATGYGVTGQTITLPAVTNTGAGSYAYNGITLTTGALIQNTGAGTDTWNGLNITMPNTTATTGTVTATGIAITGGTVTSGTAYALTTTTSAGNVGIGITAPISMLDIRPVAYGNNQSGGITLSDTGSHWNSGMFLRSSAAGVPRLGFDLSSTEYLSIYNAKVGIANTAPGTTLDVTGTGRFSTTLTASSGLTMTTGALNLTASSGSAALTLTSATDAFNIIGASSTSVLDTDTTNNRVGIGLTNPSYNLDISSSGNAYIRVSGGSAGYTDAGVILQANTDTDYRGLGTFLYQATSQKEWYIGSPYADSDSIIIGRQTGLAAHNSNTAQNANALMKITSAGNVGIGTTNPLASLQVSTLAVASTAESVARFLVSDDANSSFAINNASATDSVLMPRMSGTNSSTYTALTLQGIATTDTGTDPVVIIKASTGAGSALTTRPTFSFMNGGSVTQMLIDKSGNVGIGITTPGGKFDVESTQTSGTASLIGAPSAVSLAGALTGEAINLSTNYTATGYGVTGQSITLPAVTNTGAGTYTYNGWSLTPGAIVQNTGAGTDTWNGLNITMPNTTATTGTVTSTGIKITGGTVTSGTAYALTTTASAGNVGIQTTNPQAMLQVGNPTTVGGNIGIAGVTSGLVTINTASAAGTWTMTLPTTGGTNNYVMTTNGSGVTSWTAPGTVAASWSSLTAPSTTLTLAMAAYNTTFNWDSLTTGTGFNMASSSLSSGTLVNLATTGTAGLTNQTVLNISSSGANGTGAQTTYGLQVANTKTGTSVNVGAYLTASGGSSNYGLLVAAGNVGIGLTNPGTTLDVTGTGRFSSTLTATSGFTMTNGALSLTASSGSAALTLTSATNAFNIIGASSTSVLDADTTNNRVGIGTTAPSTNLEVSGAAGAGITITNTDTTAYGNLYLGGSGGTAYLYDFASSYMTSGRYVSSSTLLDANGSGGLGLAANNAGGIIRLYTNGSNERMRIDASGNVGIGTTTTSGAGLAIMNGKVGIGVTAPGGHLSIGGNLSSAAWGTAGIVSQSVTATYTDTSSSGTVANAVAHSLGVPEFAASSSTTYTSASTLYIAGAPAAGANVTITNAASLVVNAGNVGVGTAAPLSLVEFSKAANDTVSMANAALAVGDFHGVDVGLVGQQKAGTPYGFSLQVQNKENNTTYPLLLNPGGGNTGIGTTNPLARLSVVGTSTSVGFFTNTATSGSSAGAGVISYSDDGAALASGDRLGFILLGGAKDASHTLANSVGISGYASEAWATGATGGYLAFETVTAGGTTRTEKMRLKDDGNLGISSTNPTYTLDVTGTLRATSTTSLGNTTTGTLNASLASAGTGTALVINGTSIIPQSSSIKFKDNVQTLVVDKAAVLSLRPVTFTWNNTSSSPGVNDFGLIAEETDPKVPQLVIRNDAGVITGVKYNQLAVMLLPILQEHDTAINSVKDQINSLNDQTSTIQSNISSLTGAQAAQGNQLNSLQAQVNNFALAISTDTLSAADVKAGTIEANSITTGSLAIKSSSVTDIPLTIQAIKDQTADLFAMTDSDSVTRFAVDVTGKIASGESLPGVPIVGIDPNSGAAKGDLVSSNGPLKPTFGTGFTLNISSGSAYTANAVANQTSILRCNLSQDTTITMNQNETAFVYITSDGPASTSGITCQFGKQTTIPVFNPSKPVLVIAKVTTDDLGIVAVADTRFFIGGTLIYANMTDYAQPGSVVITDTTADNQVKLTTNETDAGVSGIVAIGNPTSGQVIMITSGSIWTRSLPSTTRQVCAVTSTSIGTIDSTADGLATKCVGRVMTNASAATPSVLLNVLPN